MKERRHIKSNCGMHLVAGQAPQVCIHQKPSAGGGNNLHRDVKSRIFEISNSEKATIKNNNKSTYLSFNYAWSVVVHVSNVNTSTNR